MKTVVVTGCATGIGLATAIATARAGWHTVATVPDLGRAGPLRDAAERAGVSLDIRALDPVDASSIASCLAGLDQVDALVNHADPAVSDATLEVAGLADIRAQMERGFFDIIAMSQAVLPALRESRGRLITVGGVRGVVGHPFDEGLAAVKAAVEAYMESLAPVAFQVGVSVSMIEPGPVLPPPAAADPEKSALAAGPYLAAYVAYRHWLATQANDGAQTPDDVAEVVVATLNAPRPAFRVATSAHAAKVLSVKLADPDGAGVQEMTRPWVTLQPDTRWRDPTALLADEELLALHRIAMKRAADLVALIRADQWSWPTPCGHWTLRELVDHMIADNVRFGGPAAGREFDGTDFADSAQFVMAAYAAPGVLDRELVLPHVRAGSTFKGRLALGFHYLDYMVHGWDVAVAIGQPFAPSPREVEVVDLIARRDVPDGQRRHNPIGGFQPPLPVASDASPWDRVLAYLGRDPRWPAG
jgi:uncharacterized protein (TIGR03086 family)